MLLRVRSWLTARAGEAYVILCTILAAFAIFPRNGNYIAYYALLIVLLPSSLVGATIQYLGGTLVLGLEQDGLVARAASFVVWVGLAVAQTVAVRRLVESSRRRT